MATEPPALSHLRALLARSAERPTTLCESDRAALAAVLNYAEAAHGWASYHTRGTQMTGAYDAWVRFREADRVLMGRSDAEG